MFDDQYATVWTDVESEKFQAARGTKQRDPLSSLLFTSAPQFAMENEMFSSRKTRLRIQLGGGKSLASQT